MKKDPRIELPAKDGVYLVEFKLGHKSTASFEVYDSFDEQYFKENIKYWIDDSEKTYSAKDMLTAYTMGCVNGNNEFDFNKWLTKI